MPVIIFSKSDYTGKITIPSLNTETTVLEVTGQTDDYIVEGYIDLSQLQSGDTLTVTEYIAIDGVNYQQFLSSQFSGPVSMPIIRFHAKTIQKNMKYKVTINQSSGTPRTIPYGFIVEVMGQT
jgi:hypothetical protein